MATIREIRRRIKSIQSTAKVTRAMEMVAASKMRRAQERTIAARPYAEKMQYVLADLAAQRQAGDEPQPLLIQRPVKRIALLHITPDRGLCGGLNANVNRRAASFILEQSVPVSIVAVGRKGRDFMVRSGQEVRAEFTRLGDKPSIVDVLPIARIAIDDYTAGIVDEVYLCYTQFVTTMTQRPALWRLLPIEPAIEPGRNIEYIYEPSPEEVLSQLLPRFVEMQLYHAILESIASEQSARMVAMRNATDNANELIEDLTLTYNKARQEMITKELLDITGGAAAI
ncbi:MAG: F0F1 ATP synthase subunit gamma, partial [Dehalococcoidia bacterium]|nr:F0F1 ATP synthase subunit gamma [Dehalococcoidia bacterium]